MLDWKRLVVKLQEKMIHGQANLPSVRLKKTLFYPGEISEWFKSQSGAARQGFLPAGNSLQCRYKGVTGCNEQRIKLGEFRKEIKCRFLVKITKNSLWILLLKIFKSRLAFFPPEDIQAQPSVRMLVEETNHCIFRMNRTRAGVYLVCTEQVFTWPFCIQGQIISFQGASCILTVFVQTGLQLLMLSTKYLYS